jgi:tRNA (guanine37-N1)-methyltransferase
MANLSLSIEQILRSVIPEELEIPSSFTQIGHIAHLNLKEQYFPWKNIIGQVILDVSHLVFMYSFLFI